MNIWRPMAGKTAAAAENGSLTNRQCGQNSLKSVLATHERPQNRKWRISGDLAPEKADTYLQFAAGANEVAPRVRFVCAKSPARTIYRQK